MQHQMRELSLWTKYASFNINICIHSWYVSCHAFLWDNALWQILPQLIKSLYIVNKGMHHKRKINNSLTILCFCFLCISKFNLFILYKKKSELLQTFNKLNSKLSEYKAISVQVTILSLTYIQCFCILRWDEKQIQTRC